MFVIKQFRLLFYINASGFVRAPNPLTIHCSFCATFCLANAQVASAIFTVIAPTLTIGARNANLKIKRKHKKHKSPLLPR